LADFAINRVAELTPSAKSSGMLDRYQQVKAIVFIGLAACDFAQVSRPEARRRTPSKMITIRQASQRGRERRGLKANVANTMINLT
jgi:hypothetical protein